MDFVQVWFISFGKGRGFTFVIESIGAVWGTPLKINMEPENEDLEDDFPFLTGDFPVPWVYTPLILWPKATVCFDFF